MQVTWYGHSAFRLDFGDKAVLIDPFFTGNPGFGGDREAASRGVTHILLTTVTTIMSAIRSRSRKKPAPRSSRILKSACG